MDCSIHNHVCRDENNSQPLAIFQSIKLCGHLFPFLYDASQEGNVIVSNTKQCFVARRYSYKLRMRELYTMHTVFSIPSYPSNKNCLC